MGAFITKFLILDANFLTRKRLSEIFLTLATQNLGKTPPAPVTTPLTEGNRFSTKDRTPNPE